MEFTVQQAGCASCGALVRTTLSALGVVDELEVDEASDSASVRLASPRDVTVDEVDELLARASEDAGHDYRVTPGSWSPTA